MNIIAEIKGVKYFPKNTSKLIQITFEKFDINECPPSCIVKDSQFNFSISKWVSPKRTRSYPYARVYNTLGFSKRITVIPIVKDEGKNGDRDFIQWDTVSLMSLLDVYVIFAYYEKAQPNPQRKDKITKQLFNNAYVKSKIIEISKYHSSALHWNLKEVDETLPFLIEKVKNAYTKISRELNVSLHGLEGLERFKNSFLEGAENFKKFSRGKAKEAQMRESLTVQPKEALSTLTKATITIKNYLGGLYYFTTDEIKIEKEKIFLIEDKHTRSNILPSIGDVKDGLLKMILYCNLESVFVNGKEFVPLPILKLTSSKMLGAVSSESSEKEIGYFCKTNELNKQQVKVISQLFEEGKENGFVVKLERA